MGHWVEDALGSVPDWVVYVTVFALPFLEASVFLGFVIPGETALVFGGVLASQGQVSLAGVLVLAIVGAIGGDAVGYAIGRRYGRGLQASRLGQKVGDSRWQVTEAFLIRRGAPAVFFGRWTAVLRAMVPSAAGMARLPYRKFAIWNALGGTLWAVIAVVGGYVVGDVIGSYISNIAYVIVALVLIAAIVHLVRSRRSRSTSDLSER